MIAPTQGEKNPAPRRATAPIRLHGPVEHRADDAAPLSGEGSRAPSRPRPDRAPRTRSPRRRRRGARASGSRCCRSRPRRSRNPRSAGWPGSTPSRRTRPAASARSQRSSVSMALKAIAPSWSSTLIFGNSGLPSRSTRNTISIADRAADVDDARRHPVVRNEPHRRGSSRGRCRVPRRRGHDALRPRAVRLVEVVGDHLGGAARRRRPARR